jgi:DNA-binding protein HU-beta
MTKRQLIEVLARKAHLTKRAAEEAVEVFLAEIGRSLSKGEKVLLSGFGTFYVHAVMKSRTVKIPNSTKMATIKPHRTPKFTPGKSLKKSVQR